jgi:hypothetical protein
MKKTSRRVEKIFVLRTFVIGVNRNGKRHTVYGVIQEMSIAGDSNGQCEKGSLYIYI